MTISTSRLTSPVPSGLSQSREGSERPSLGSRQSSLFGVPSHSKARLLPQEQATKYNYNTTTFDGRPAQMATVRESLLRSGFIPGPKVEAEVDWFYNELGIDNSYFAHESVDNICSYILSLYSAKVSTAALPAEDWNLQFQRQSDDHAVFLDTTIPGVSDLNGSTYEEIVDKQYLTPSKPSKAFRLETFRCQDVLEYERNPKQLRCYFVNECQFFDPDVHPNETSLEKVADRGFWNRASEHTKSLYQNLIEKAVSRMGPVAELYEIEGVKEARMVIAYRMETAPGFFSSLSYLYHYYGLTTSRKYVEQFSNGITVLSLYLQPAPQFVIAKNELLKNVTFQNSIFQVYREVSLLYSIPKSLYAEELASGKLSLQEAIYAHCGCIFVTHFLNRLGPEYRSLVSTLDLSKTDNLELVDRLKQRLRGETFTRKYVEDLIRARIDIVKELYLDFAKVHYVGANNDSDHFWYTETILEPDEIRKLVRKNSSDEHEITVMEALLVFNSQILKTNFYTPTKAAVSFRLDPSFLPVEEYPQPLYGMFLVVGQEFRGFHLRFRDVARGGIRIVKSRNKEAYSINARNLFNENYNLANTQQRKNKDIPEGGSKGVILLNVEHQDKPTQSFQKYIDALIDLLIPGESPGIKEAIADYYGQEEILFMGPDENTAGLVDWATQHAKARNALWWKSFFTGKSPQVGGIPHDKYGMTSLSVREYVKGIYRRQEITEKPVRKLQTGGPDGDLGSNEILLSTDNESYIAIVDGSGVLADPQGLDKEELIRLAKKRVMISEYDVSKLSAEGYRVLVDDADVTLPNGSVIDSGVTFRNTYHLEAAKMHKIDVFVPCGGRPEAINLENASNFIDENGKARIPYIVEGANLFITQAAKLLMEKSGAIIYKDASANKGGVTSSSLEVLASLAFEDDGFFSNMCVSKDGVIPEFYKQYVEGVQERIKLNAKLEFEAIYRDHLKTGIARSILSDDLSNSINSLSDELINSRLWDDEPFRNSVLRAALPKVLVDKLGLPAILNRVPDAYLRAIFGSYLAGRYVYEAGTTADQFAFYDFMTTQRAAIAHEK